MKISFLTALYYVTFCLLGLISGYYLGFNLFLLICELFEVANPPHWLNVLFAAGFGLTLAIIYLIIAFLLHGLKNITWKLIDAFAEFLTNLIYTISNHK